MKFLFMFLLQLITVGLLIKLAIKFFIPRPIRKLFAKSTMALIRCSCELINELKNNFENDDDSEYDDGVDDGKVINIVQGKRNRM